MPRRAPNKTATIDIIPPQTSRWAVLMPELLSEIHRFLTDEYNEWKMNKDAATKTHLTKRKKQAMLRHPLLTATLVNRHWNVFATRDLWRRIHVHTIETLNILLKAVTHNPRLLDYINSFSLDYYYNEYPLGKKLYQKEYNRRKKAAAATWEFLGLLKPGTLRSLSVEMDSLGPLATEVADTQLTVPCLTGLKNLVFDDIRGYRSGCSANSAAWLFAAAPTLENICLPMTSCHSLPPYPTLPNLKGVWFPNQDRLEEGFIRDFVKFMTRLERLSIGSLFIKPDVFELLMNVSPTTVRELHVSLTFDGFLNMFTWENRFKVLVDVLITALPRYTNLVGLQLWMNGYDVVFADLVKALPPSLRWVTICTTDSKLKEHVGLVEILLIADFSQLQTIAIPGGDWHKEISPEDAVMLDELQDRCGQRNIKLSFEGHIPDQLPWTY